MILFANLSTVASERAYRALRQAEAHENLLHICDGPDQIGTAGSGLPRTWATSFDRFKCLLEAGLGAFFRDSAIAG